jgi:hypothetical protein
MLVLLSVLPMPLPFLLPAFYLLKSMPDKGKEENSRTHHITHHSADHPGNQLVYWSDHRWVGATLAGFLPNRYT